MVLALISSAVSFGLWRLGWLERLESLSWDWRARLTAAGPTPQSEQIVIVAVDQASLDWMRQEQALNWPWPREAYAVIVDFCARAGCASLTMDLLLSEPSVYGSGDDEILRQAAAGYNHLSLPLFLKWENAEESLWPAWAEPSLLHLSADQGPEIWPQALSGIFPVQEVAHGVQLGHAHGVVDADGVYRRLRPVLVLAGRPIPALGLASFLTFMGPAEIRRDRRSLSLRALDDSWNRLLPLDDEGRLILHYRGPAESYSHYSAAAVVQSELLLRHGQPPLLSPEFFADKHVLFGLTAPGLFDLRPTPMDGQFAGVEIHANVLDNFLAGLFTMPAPSWLALLCLFGFSFDCISSALGKICCLCLNHLPINGTSRGKNALKPYAIRV